MKHLTIRGVPPDLARELKSETRRRGKSLTETVKDLLRQALGLEIGIPYDNGLGRLAGGWSEGELAEFERATAPFEQIDAELWQDDTT